MKRRAGIALGKALVCGTIVLLATGCGDDNTVTAPATTPVDNPAHAEMLEAPGGVMHRGLDDGDLLRWNAPAATPQAEVSGYNLYVYDPSPDRPDDPYVKANGSPLAGARYHFGDLLAGSVYHVKVRALNSDMIEGAWSQTYSFTATGPYAGTGGLEMIDGDEYAYDPHRDLHEHY